MVIICWSGVTNIFLLFAMEQLCSGGYLCGRYGGRSASMSGDGNPSGLRRMEYEFFLSHRLFYGIILVD